MAPAFAQLVLASDNPGKLAELHRLLHTFVGKLIPQAELGIPAAAEPHPTFVHNALAKAYAASTAAKLPALADDSGLCVKALGGAPGVLSARYAGTGNDADNNHKLLHELAGETMRQAHYHATIVLVRHAADPDPLIAQGRWYGTIATAPAGNNGFGYDPLFLVNDHQTAAQLSPQEKDANSHRAQAIAALIKLLEHE